MAVPLSTSTHSRGTQSHSRSPVVSLTGMTPPHLFPGLGGPCSVVISKTPSPALIETLYEERQVLLHCCDKHRDQKQPGEEGVYLASSFKSIVEAGMEPLTGSLALTCSAAFLILPRAPSPGMALPTVGGTSYIDQCSRKYRKASPSKLAFKRLSSPTCHWANPMEGILWLRLPPDCVRLRAEADYDIIEQKSCYSDQAFINRFCVH